MIDFLYLKMLLDGLQDHGKYLPQYLIREQKKAEREFIEFDEFIHRTISVIEAIEGYLRLQYNDNKSNKNDGIKIDTSFWDFTIPISKLTNDQFKGEIGLKHTNDLRTAINAAFKFYQYEDESIEFIEYRSAEKKLAGSKVRENNNEEPEGNKQSEIFKKNGYKIWTLLFENLQIIESSRTDLRFMYEIMKHHGLIHSTVTITNMTNWINDTYEFAIEKLPYTNIKSLANNKRFYAFNLVSQANPS